MRKIFYITLMGILLSCSTKDNCWKDYDSLKEEFNVLNNMTKTSHQNKVKKNQELIISINDLKDSYNCSEEFKEKYKYKCDKLILEVEKHLENLIK